MYIPLWILWLSSLDNPGFKYDIKVTNNLDFTVESRWQMLYSLYNYIFQNVHFLSVINLYSTDKQFKYMYYITNGLGKLPYVCGNRKEKILKQHVE